MVNRPAMDRTSHMSRADMGGLLACAVGIAIVTPGLTSGGLSADAAVTVSIAETTFALAGVRRRPFAALVWDDLDVGETIREADTIFVPNAATATVRFHDGARLTLAPGSMATLRLSQAAPEIALTRGHVRVDSSESALRIRGAGGVIAVGAATGALVTADEHTTRVEVTRGEARVEGESDSAKLSSGQITSLTSAGAVTPTTTLVHRLASPSFGQTVFYVRQPPAVRLVWSPAATAGTRLEVASDGAFSNIDTSVAVVGTTQPFKTDRGGLFWWRLVNEAGVAVSGANMFVLVENEPPVLVTPASKAIVHVPKGKPIRFVWTESASARSYELEITSDEGFAAPLVTATTEDNRYAFDGALADGRYFWRVRVADADRGFSPHSRTQSFWLVRRPILVAPGDLEVQVEVKPP